MEIRRQKTVKFYEKDNPNVLLWVFGYDGHPATSLGTPKSTSSMISDFGFVLKNKVEV